MKIDLTSFKNRPENIIIIVFAFILIGIVAMIILIVSTFTPEPQEGNAIQQPTIAAQSLKALPPLIYDEHAEKRLAEKIKNPEPLSLPDTQAKNTMLASVLKNESGILFESPRVRLEYVKTANAFQAQILSTDILTAKAEAANWLKQQGLSDEALCQLPIMFYVDPFVVQQLNGNHIFFSPLLNGC